MNTRRKAGGTGANGRRGIALVLVVVFMLILFLLFSTALFFFKQGTKQLAVVIDETVLINACDAVITNAVNKLKNGLWEDRYYKAEPGDSGADSTSPAGDEDRGVLTDSALVDKNYNVDWYYYVGDVTDDQDRIIPNTAQLFVYVSCSQRKIARAVHCTILFRPLMCRATYQRESLVVTNYFVLPADWHKEEPDPETAPLKLKERADERLQKARVNRLEKRGLARVIEKQINVITLPGSEIRSNPGMIYNIQTVLNLGSGELQGETAIAEQIEKARETFREFRIASYNSIPMPNVPVPDLFIDYDIAITEVIKAVQTAFAINSGNLPRYLFLLGNLFMAKGDVTGNVLQLDGTVLPDEVVEVKSIREDLGKLLPWPPGDLVLDDYETIKNDKIKLYRRAESCFYSIIQAPEKTEAHSPASYLKLVQVEQKLAFDNGKYLAKKGVDKVIDVMLEEALGGPASSSIHLDRPFDREDMRMDPEIIKYFKAEEIEEDLLENFEIGDMDGEKELIDFEPLFLQHPENLFNITPDTHFVKETAYSPCGGRTLFTVRRGQEFGQDYIYVMDTRGGGKAVSIYKSYLDKIWGVAFSPDGSKVLFTAGPNFISLTPTGPVP